MGVPKLTKVKLKSQLELIESEVKKSREAGKKPDIDGLKSTAQSQIPNYAQFKVQADGALSCVALGNKAEQCYKKFKCSDSYLSKWPLSAKDKAMIDAVVELAEMMPEELKGPSYYINSLSEFLGEVTLKKARLISMTALAKKDRTLFEEAIRLVKSAKGVTANRKVEVLMDIARKIVEAGLYRLALSLEKDRTSSHAYNIADLVAGQMSRKGQFDEAIKMLSKASSEHAADGLRGQLVKDMLKAGLVGRAQTLANSIKSNVSKAYALMTIAVAQKDEKLAALALEEHKKKYIRGNHLYFLNSFLPSKIVSRLLDQEIEKAFKEGGVIPQLGFSPLNFTWNLVNNDPKRAWRVADRVLSQIDIKTINDSKIRLQTRLYDAYLLLNIALIKKDIALFDKAFKVISDNREEFFKRRGIDMWHNRVADAAKEMGLYEQAIKMASIMDKKHSYTLLTFRTIFEEMTKAGHLKAAEGEVNKISDIYFKLIALLGILSVQQDEEGLDKLATIVSQRIKDHQQLYWAMTSIITAMAKSGFHAKALKWTKYLIEKRYYNYNTLRNLIDSLVDPPNYSFCEFGH